MAFWPLLEALRYCFTYLWGPGKAVVLKIKSSSNNNDKTNITVGVMAIATILSDRDLVIIILA